MKEGTSRRHHTHIECIITFNSRFEFDFSSFQFNRDPLHEYKKKIYQFVCTPPITASMCVYCVYIIILINTLLSNAMKKRVIESLGCVFVLLDNNLWMSIRKNLPTDLSSHSGSARTKPKSICCSRARSLSLVTQLNDNCYIGLMMMMIE